MRFKYNFLVAYFSATLYTNSVGGVRVETVHCFFIGSGGKLSPPADAPDFVRFNFPADCSLTAAYTLSRYTRCPQNFFNNFAHCSFEWYGRIFI